MAKLVLTDQTNTYNATSINEQFQRIEDEFQNEVLYRKNPTGEPNAMENPIDMNSQRILNLPEPLTNTEAARLQDIKNALAGGAANLISFTPTGTVAASNVQAAIVEVASEAVALPTLAAPSGAGLLGFLPDGIGSVATTVQVKLRESVSVIDKGASLASTTAQNRTALQTAITSVDAAGGGVVRVPNGIDYGFKNTDLTTYPSFAGIVNDVTVWDEGIGDADGSGNKAGAQTRVFYGTAQTTPVGMHDGNGHWVYGSWHPYYSVMNTANLAAVGHASRLASDNRRASWLLNNDGKTTWRLGQGTLAGAAFTNEELSNFVLEHYQTTGDTKVNYAPLIIERKTGNWSFGGGANIPETSYDFTSVTAGYYQGMFKSPFSTTCTIILRNSAGAADDVYLRNVAGNVVFNIPSQGDALSIDKTTRKTTLKSLALGVSAPAYGASVAIDAASGQSFNITATNGVGFNILSPANQVAGCAITIRIRNTSGAALGAASWAVDYKMAAWTQPANGFSRAITFCYDGTNWVEVSRNASDIPN